MTKLTLLSLLAVTMIVHAGAEPLSVAAEFEGASVRVTKIDQEKRAVSYTPGGDPARGWPCWWYFRIDGVTPGETITLQLRGSKATVGKPGAPMHKPLSPMWAMPKRAAFSTDGIDWKQTEKGVRRDGAMIYQVTPDTASVFVAWGPPYTPSKASETVGKLSQRSRSAKTAELCRSRKGRSVPILHVLEGDLPRKERFGVWVQARQHAWECGSSWVAQGFMEWLTGDDKEAAWLRRNSEVFVVPIMDVDNVATGNGGKNAQPHDHNRDWSPNPNWNEVRAAQKKVLELIDEKRMDIFLDLHNPAPGDPSFFYTLDEKLLAEPKITLRNRFIDLAYARISGIKPMIPMSNKPKVTGASYHPRWRNISANWVSMHGNPHTVGLTFETIWNSPRSTPGGYRAVGAALANAVSEFLAERKATHE